ncbi:MAG: Uma2 family endonuclease [Byssovorax sp.]
MGDAAQRIRMTPAEYLAFERSAETKHEYADGEIFAMAGAKRGHNLIVTNVTAELRQALRDRPCEVYPSDMRVHIASAERYVYPDVSVVCGEPIFLDDTEDTLENPMVLVEVTSDSTEGYDRGDKFAKYRTVRSVVDYVIVSHHSAAIDHYTRMADGSWRLLSYGPGERFTLSSCQVELSVDEVYLKVFPVDEAS